MKALSKHQLAGIVLVTTSLGFVAVFSYLAAKFGYPAVLDGKAEDVLPALVSGGTLLRFVWTVYALLPSGVALAALLAFPLFAPAGLRLARIGRAAAIVSALAMTLGLARWPTLQWALGERFLKAGAPERSELAAVFDAANLYLGNVTGEFIGELGLVSWFATLSVAVLRGVGLPRWLGYFGLLTAASMAVGAFRNLTSTVQLVADVNNNLLPIWLIALGVLLTRAGKGARLTASHAPPELNTSA